MNYKNLQKEIVKFDEDTVRFSLGNFGIDLLNFSKSVDLNHFAIDDIFFDSDICEKIIQILKIVQYSKENNLHDCLQGIDKFFLKKIPKETKSLHKKFTRLIKNKNQRENIRKNKKVSNVSLFSFYENPKSIWNNISNDFDMYSRNSESYKKLIFQGKEKADRYKLLGCNQLYQDIIDYLNNIEKLMSENYFGYHRISVKNAAVILSKINGFKLNKIKDELLICLKENVYVPKLYPFYYLEKIKTDRISSIIEDLENPPLFDHYMVLVPSILNQTEEKDIKEIDEKNIIPILLGEKDGKCYFISYWI